MLLSKDEETIVALCTPIGSGAIALIRISGTDAVAICSRISILASGKSLADQPTHTIHYGSVIDDQKNVIDQVLFLLMHGPQTFTGQDTVEITCHNNPFIIESIITGIVSQGGRIAHNGEFTKRAVLNNKIDLVQAEAINELIHANTQMTLKQSLAQLKGSFSHWITRLEKDLIRALALCQASFEFIEEENIEFGDGIRTIIEQTLATIATLKTTFDQQQNIRNGIRIALIGSVNAGKSSLFNALLEQERSIVTDIAGTTRDVVEAGLYRAGNYWTLIDTAGLRQTNDIVEQEGIKRSYEQAHKADIVLLIVDGARAMTPQEETIYADLFKKYAQKIIVVHTKSDLARQTKLFMSEQALTVSSSSRSQLDVLNALLQEKITSLFSSLESPFLINKRHHALLLQLESQLITVVDQLHAPIAYEIVAYHLNDAIANVSELSGKTTSEAAMDAVFREFCVGK